MNLKRLALAVLGAFATIFAVECVIHHGLLSDFYKAHASWWRPEAEMKAMMPFLLAAQVSLASLLVLVYAKGYEAGKGALGQGIRFGLLMGLLLMLPSSLMDFVIYPYPPSLISTWLIGGMIELTLAGAVIGLVYKPAK